MRRLIIYLQTILLSSLIGVAIEAGITLFAGHTFSWVSLFYNMAISAIIGSICLFFILFVFVRLKKKTWVAVVLDFAVVAICIGHLFITECTRKGFCGFSLHWFVLFMIAEISSIFVTVYFCRQMNWYNSVLESKKAALKNDPY